MSIHHLDTFRYWLGDPLRVLAARGPTPGRRSRTPMASTFTFSSTLGCPGVELGRCLERSVRDRAGADLGIRCWALTDLPAPSAGPACRSRPSTLDYTSAAMPGPGIVCDG